MAADIAHTSIGRTEKARNRGSSKAGPLIPTSGKPAFSEPGQFSEPCHFLNEEHVRKYMRIRRIHWLDAMSCSQNFHVGPRFNEDDNIIDYGVRYDDGRNNATTTNIDKAVKAERTLPSMLYA